MTADPRTYTGEFPPDGSHPTVDSLVAALATSVERVRMKYAIAVQRFAAELGLDPNDVLAEIDEQHAAEGQDPFIPASVPADVPEFWVLTDKHEGVGIWQWDGTKLTERLNQIDVVYGYQAADREVRARIWDRILTLFPTAPPCKFADGCKDVAITNPQYCPAHTEET